MRCQDYHAWLGGPYSFVPRSVEHFSTLSCSSVDTTDTRIGACEIRRIDLSLIYLSENKKPFLIEREIENCEKAGVKSEREEGNDAE